MYISSPENYVANPYQNLLLYLNGIWQEVRFDASPKAFKLTNAYLQTIKVYHPGGNFSNYHFSFA